MGIFEFFKRARLALRRRPLSAEEVLDELSRLPTPKSPSDEMLFLELNFAAKGKWNHLTRIMPKANLSPDVAEKWNQENIVSFAMMVVKSRSRFGEQARLTVLLTQMLHFFVMETIFKGRSDAADQATKYVHAVLQQGTGEQGHAL